jgi:DNA-binding NarL/FixJ family response regulator
MLIADSLYAVLGPVMPFLNRSDISVHTGARHDELIRLHFEHAADLIITRPDLPGMSCESFVTVIRRSEALRKVSLLLLVDNDLAQRERALRIGANCILPLAAPTDAISQKIHGLLNIAPRRSYRVIMNIAVEGRRSSKPFMCSMENVSAHGMLIRTAEVLSPGDRIQCSFFLPDGTRVAAEGTVVRTVPGTGGLPSQKYGVQFLGMSQADESAISSFVERELKRQQESAEVQASEHKRVRL